jgi:hypothetical protein
VTGINVAAPLVLATIGFAVANEGVSPLTFRNPLLADSFAEPIATVSANGGQLVAESQVVGNPRPFCWF